MTDSDHRIEAVLRGIYDPCSVAQQNPINLIDMGLIIGWELDGGGRLEVRMCVTSACCTMAPHFTEAARERLMMLSEVCSVDVVVDAGFFWTPDRMTALGKKKLAARRQATLTVTGVRPMEWKELARARS